MSASKSFVTKLKDLESPSKSDEEHDVSPSDQDENDIDWFDDENFEGQLAVDVYQTDKSIVIKSTIAGVRPEDIDISINNDMVTIKGLRRNDETTSDDQYFYRECYWGGFSRSIILPVDIKEERVKASIKNGVLTVILPKAGTSKVHTIEVEDKDEED